MGQSFLPRSWRLTAAFTLAWRVNLVSPPPPSFLALLLAGFSVLALPSDARADEVKLKQYNESVTQNGSGTLTFSTGPDVQRAAGMKKVYFYGLGVGLTNDLREWRADTTVVGPDGPYPFLIYYDALNTTNKMEHGWLGTNLAIGDHRQDTHTVQTNYDLYLTLTEIINTNEISSATNQSITFNTSEPWLGADFSTAETNDGYVITYGEVRKSDVVLITSTNVGWSGSALFKLTVGLKDAYQNAITSGYKVDGKTPDTNGVVWSVFNDGTTNPVSPEITATNTITNYTFTVGRQRVQLTGLLWWNPTSSNWSSGPLFVMSNSTVTFTITANVDGVQWPTNFPVWNCEGRTQTGGTTFTHTFTNISSSVETPFAITATAGNMVSNSIVAYSVGATRTPDDNFSGRSTNEFGVCEILNFALTITPADLPASEIAVIDWQFSATDTNATFSTTSSGTGSATLFGPSKATTINTSVGIGDNFQLPRYFTWASPFTLPNNLVCVPTTVTIAGYGPNVWHEPNTGSCGKMLLFYLVPANVSFREIEIREGTSTNEFGTGVLSAPAPHEVGGWRSVNAGDATKGCLVNTVDQASTGPWGVGQPRTCFAPNGSTNGSTRGFDIWIEYKGKNEGNDAARKLFTVPWRVSISPNGKTEIKKDSMTPIAREWDAPYSNY